VRFCGSYLSVSFIGDVMEVLNDLSRNSLSITCRDEPGRLLLMWNGKSDERNPAMFLTPMLDAALERLGDRELVLNFRSLEFMNSSTITPIIKMLDRSRQLKSRVTLIYRKALKWQELNFSALSVFETPDGRIKVRGL
jgi:hypothetical protein